MSLIALIGALELGLAYAPLALGIFISFRILNFPDLTVDGSFVLGAAVTAVYTGAGHPFEGMLMGFLAGALAGVVTALLQTKLGVQPILSGILTMTGLYSINLIVMKGKSNLPMLGVKTVFTKAQSVFGDTYYKVIVLLVIIGAVYLIYNLFFKTQLGLSIRATGDNEAMVRASSLNTDLAKIVAIAVSNALVALSGALVAQMQGSADVSMGSGMVVIGLASVIIGEVIVGRRGLWLGMFSAIAGSLIYRLIIAFVLRSSMPPSYLKLISALVVTVAIAVPSVRRRLQLYKLIRKENRHA